MLSLKNIVKTYNMGDTSVKALRGISLDFRESEFVAILGPSGCGKTTLLNIVGGLDRYDSGDLVINGVSTKKYRDADWDAFRNHRIGFVFQSYNLIPHQTVLANVELALTLSGVSKAERRRRAAEALTAVGLSDQLNKKPNQLSGGQMQRVAVARALVNNPDILLADEPTGALDSETSVQLMEILKDISTRKLVIMVTHNPELAEQYATRIVRLRDGSVLSDTNPPTSDELAAMAPKSNDASKKKGRGKKKEKTSMSFFTALSLSLTNLMTKKTRTFLTSFAGSIGIIGIALITALSNGVQAYINRVQEDTLSSYPIVIEAESVDMGALISSLMKVGNSSGTKQDGEEPEDRVYSNAIMYELINTINSTEVNRNNLTAFRKFLFTPDENGKRPLDSLATAIKEDYDIKLSVYTSDSAGKIVKSDSQTIMTNMMKAFYGMDPSSAGGNMAMSYYSNMQGFQIWEEMLAPGSNNDNEDGYLINPLLLEQYDVIYGDWPKEYNEVVLIVDGNNTVSDLVLYALGLISYDEMAESFKAAAEGKQIEITRKSWSFEEITNIPLKMILPSERYIYNEEAKRFVDLAETDTGLSLLYGSAQALQITGIVRTSDRAVSGMLSGSIGYTSALTDYIIEQTVNSEVVKKQLENPDIDVLSGLPFADSIDENMSDADKAAAVREFLALASTKTKAEIYLKLMSTPSEEYINNAVGAALAGMTRDDIIDMMISAVSQQMPSADIEKVRSYVMAMDDETLYGYVREMMAERISAEYAAAVMAQLGAFSEAELSAMLDGANLTDEQLAALYEDTAAPEVSKSTLEENLELFGFVDVEKPKRISIYAKTFEDKNKIADIIAKYNEGVDETDKINYTDYVALLMSSVTTIINAISYVLMAFVSVSLIVSSIMIGIITYVSVLERTKEIGILRSIGASKKDVTRVFNAETLIIGFASGAIGIIITVLLCFPINFIIRRLTDIQSLGAALPPVAAVILLVISMTLTLVAGLIPSLIAAKKDPVVALRTE